MDGVYDALCHSDFSQANFEPVAASLVRALKLFPDPVESGVLDDRLGQIERRLHNHIPLLRRCHKMLAQSPVE